MTLQTQSLLLCNTRICFEKFHVLPTQCICVFCVDLRTNSDYFPIQQQLTRFITETDCVYCAVRTGSLYIILRSAHTVYLCVLCGSENKQRLFPYTASTDWVYNRDGLCLLHGTDWIFIYNSTFCPHSVFMCFVWLWEQTAIISLYSINWLVFITETECLLRGTDWILTCSCGCQSLKVWCR